MDLDNHSDVAGAKELTEWFGCWPSFHDAEVLSIKLDRKDFSNVRVHAFEKTDQVDSQGYYICTKHAIITFILQRVANCHLTCFFCQNVISGLALNKTSSGYELALKGCFGVEGTITAEDARIQIEPGIPVNSQYQRLARA